MRCIDQEDNQNLFTRVEMSQMRWYSFKVRGGKLKGDVWGKIFYTCVGVTVVEADMIVPFKVLLCSYRNMALM